MTLSRILSEVGDERLRQEQLKAAGRFKFTCADIEMSDGERAVVLVEEVGEVARAVLERLQLADDTHNTALRGELVQIAAVAVAWIEGLDRAALAAQRG